MKKLYLILSFCFLLMIGLKASAQNNYAITGTVHDEKGQPLASATVFLSQSESITMSNDDGRFMFGDMEQGSYRLIITMVGYSPFEEDIILKAQSADIEVKLKLKPVALKQVNIGGKDHWNDQFETFKKAFLGSTHNGNLSVITNPKVVYFSTRKDTLFANADDFLLIENPNLGYRIKYLLKYFSYSKHTRVALYDGDISFEPMKGTPKLKEKWDKNRLDAYRGSFMHLLRSVYRNSTNTEGFIVNPVYKEYKRFNLETIETLHVVDVDARPINFDTIAHPVDSAFVAVKFNTLYVDYSPKKIISGLTADTVAKKRSELIDNKSTSLIKLYGKETLIDRRGAHNNFRDFLLMGKFGQKRVGDQLPLEYQPPLNIIASK